MTLKKKRFRLMILILLGLTAVIIFGFSSQDGKKSGNISRQVVRQVVDVLPKTKELSDQKKEAIVEDSQAMIRKGAHFIIYLLVGVLSMVFFSAYAFSIKKRCLFSLGCGILYAISDEIHQIFIPGRTAKVMDVAIDTIGVIVGISLVLLVLYLKNRNNRKRKIEASYR